MNTLDTIKKQCSEKGWNGYDCPPISELVLSRAKQIESYIPKDFELFPAGDNSVQGNQRMILYASKCMKIWCIYLLILKLKIGSHTTR